MRWIPADPIADHRLATPEQEEEAARFIIQTSLNWMIEAWCDQNLPRLVIAQVLAERAAALRASP